MNPQQQRLLAQSNNLFVKSGRFISYKIGSMNGLSDKHREETAPAGELRRNVCVVVIYSYSLHRTPEEFATG
jgi:hypothetical protein